MTLAADLSIAFIVIGVLMLLAEAAMPGNFLLVPATVLLVLGALGFVFPDLLLSVWGPLAAVIVLAPSTYLTIKLYQKIAPPAPPETRVATSLIGTTGIITVEVRPDSLKGKVKIDHESWSATAKCVIPVGKRVAVKSSEGVHVFVEEINEDGKPVCP
jgi:membrane protein implicated in regulation of membrane protease activity